MEKYNSKGFITFYFAEDGIKERKVDFDELDKVMRHCWIYDLMSGENFYKCVDDGGFINYDGNIADIFVDGYESNLGLSHKGLHQGKFMVDGTTFRRICQSHKVEVNWANN